jgi:hypothetical protein
MVTVATLGVPRTAPALGPLSVTVNVSAGSLSVSATIGTLMTRLVIPGPNVSVPPVATKSAPAVAVTPASA